MRPQPHCPVLGVTWPWGKEKEGDGSGKHLASVSSLPIIVEVKVDRE